MTSLIPEDYYDLCTHALLLTTLTEEDKEYMNSTNDGIVFFLFKRWRMIVTSFPENYCKQYLSLSTAETRNEFIKKYLAMESHDMAEMPKWV